MIGIYPSVTQSSKLIREFILPHWENCIYCNRKVSASMTVDHIVPKSNYDSFIELLPNGMNSIENLLISCRRCNNLRGNMPFSTWVSEYRPDTVINFINFLKKINGIQFEGVDYSQSLFSTVLNLLEIEKKDCSHAEKVIKQFDITL